VVGQVRRLICGHPPPSCAGPPRLSPPACGWRAACRRPPRTLSGGGVQRRGRTDRRCVLADQRVHIAGHLLTDHRRACVRTLRRFPGLLRRLLAGTSSSRRRINTFHKGDIVACEVGRLKTALSCAPGRLRRGFDQGTRAALPARTRCSAPHAVGCLPGSDGATHACAAETAIAGWVFCQVLLMVVLGKVELRGAQNLGRNGAVGFPGKRFLVHRL
jgi:hypothetical protein